MNFNKHSSLAGTHAFLGASKYHWINYDADKLAATFMNYQASQRGVELHDFAKRCIELGIKLQRSQKSLNMYVNDAIGFRMTPEQILYYSDNCYGTADAISFKSNLLRIHDFKSGVVTSSMHQLEVYAAMFCLEYNMRPGNINMELRIYQNDEVVAVVPDTDFIAHIMDKIITFDKMIEKLKAEG